MYFRNKFNKEIQKLTRNMPEIGASTTIGEQENNPLFLFQGSKHTETINPYYLKVFPLVMYDTLESSNKDDIVYNDSDLEYNVYSGCIICKNTPGTIIKCGRKKQ